MKYLPILIEIFRALDSITIVVIVLGCAEQVNPEELYTNCCRLAAIADAAYYHVFSLADSAEICRPLLPFQALLSPEYKSLNLP